MSNGDQKVCNDVRNAFGANQIEYEEGEIQNATRFTLKAKGLTAWLSVFNTGKLQVQGKNSPLKEWLSELKSSIEAGGAAPATMLPADIEKFPATLRERVPDCDEVVLWFF